MLKLLACALPSIGFLLMRESGLLAYVLPELDAAFGVGQNRFHADDVAMHTLLCVDALHPRYPFYRWVTLLHDLGKVPCKLYKPEKGDYVFYSHQYASKRMGKRIMRRLRFSNKEIDTAASIVENHMYNLKPGLSEGAIRRFVRRLGRDRVEGFLRMRLADRRGNRFNDASFERGVFHFVRTLRKIDRDENALTVRNLKISGYDLIEMGLPPGPLFSQILDHLLELVLDDPELNQREGLLGHVRAFVEEFRRTGAITIPPTSSPSREEEEAEEAENE